MVKKDGTLTKPEEEWIEEFKKLMDRAPKGIELILDDGGIDIYKAGSLGKHLGSKHDGAGMSGNPSLHECYIDSIKKGILVPYSEGQ